MEFGANWLQPIQGRLSKKFQALTSKQLDHYDEICREAMNYGNSFIHDKYSVAYDHGIKISTRKLKEDFTACMKDKYPWINNSNLHALFSQGRYYAGHDGLVK